MLTRQEDEAMGACALVDQPVKDRRALWNPDRAVASYAIAIISDVISSDL